MVFWIAALVMAAAVAALMVLALYRGGAERRAAEADVQVYKDQLREVERDLARGTVTEAEAETVRTEVARRLLEADRAAQMAGGGTRTAPGAVTAGIAGLTAVVVVGGAAWLYWVIGAPGYPDLPLAERIAAAEEARRTRPSQEQAEAEAAAMPRLPVEASEEYLELMDRLRATVAERPTDVQGQRLLARNEAGLGNFVAAREAQAQVIALLGENATAEDYADYADSLVLAAGGYVSPAAEAMLARALERDPTNGAARYYSGLLMVQTGRPDLAFRLWSSLLAQSQPGDPWIPPVMAQIEGLARAAGVQNYTPPEFGQPPAIPGPTREQMEAAADMTPEERQEMIRGMVSGLMDRLANEGGPPEDWARLIGALGVLGDTDRARAISDEALQVFADDTGALAMIRDARARAGLE